MALTGALLSGSAVAEPGLRLVGQPQIPGRFCAFDYVHAQAPRAGQLRLVSNSRASTFDKYNPFTIKGSAPAYLSQLLFDSLLAGSAGRNGHRLWPAGRGCAAWPPDRLSATFRLRPQARFHNGEPVLAEDVKHSFDTLGGAAYLAGLQNLAHRRGRGGCAGCHARCAFAFEAPNRELPLTVGSLPFSAAPGAQGKPFDQVVMEPPIGSGPYRIGPVRLAKTSPTCWIRSTGREICLCAVASSTLHRVEINIYKDGTAKLEALKAGEFDVDALFQCGRLGTAREWQKNSTRRTGQGRICPPAAHRLSKLCAQHPQAACCKTCACARPWGWRWITSGCNRQMFYGAYQRVNSLFRPYALRGPGRAFSCRAACWTPTPTTCRRVPGPQSTEPRSTSPPA